jgi:hypothetical protein
MESSILWDHRQEPQHKTKLLLLLREREIQQLNTWKRVISASLKAFTPLHLTATTVPLPTLTQPNMWCFTGEQVSLKHSCWQVRWAVRMHRYVNCWNVIYDMYSASNFSSVWFQGFLQRGRKLTFVVHFPSAAAFPNKGSAERVSGSARNRGQFNNGAQKNKYEYSNGSKL